MGIKVLGIAGSLRKGSYNKLTLRAALELKPADMEIESFDIAPIPRPIWVGPSMWTPPTRDPGLSASVMHSTFPSSPSWMFRDIFPAWIRNTGESYATGQRCCLPMRRRLSRK
mgnify:CR=1 FL=1